MSGNSTTHMLFAPLPDNPLVSVLMPAYNAAPFLKNALNSILNQTHTNWELLLLDDGSTDRTADIIQEIADVRVRKFSNIKNEGYLKACNQLFSEVKGDLVTFLDADDTCIPERFALCIAALREDSDLGFVTTDFSKVDNQGTVLSKHIQTINFDRIANDSTYLPTLCCATIFLRSSLLDKVGGYHPFFDRIGGEDYYWLFHLSLNSKGINLATCSYFYTTHPNQTHIRNQSDLKYFIFEIVSELRRRRIDGDVDSITDSEHLFKKWEAYINDNIYELMFRRASSALNNGEGLKSLWLSFSIATSAPLNKNAWIRFIYMLYSIVYRYVKS